MKSLIQSCIIAFSMYSRLPMPTVDWKKTNMLYTLCFFPFVGIVVGGLIFLWLYIALRYNIGITLTASIATVLPLVITGGIHFDGFCDTFDALSSNASKERKQEILKDPHVGTFAVIAAIVYILLYFALWSQYTFDEKSIAIICLGFFISRSLSAISVVSLKHARKDGLSATFSEMAEKRHVFYVVAIFLMLAFLFAFYIDIILALIILISVVLIYLHYVYIAYQKFGGINGDLAGFFLQNCEFIILFVIVFYQIFRV